LFRGELTLTSARALKFKETGRSDFVGKALELSAIRKDGTEFQIELSLSAFKTNDKWRLVGISRDITERKKAEEKIRKLTEEWMKRFDAISDSVFVLDVDFRFVRVNKATCDFLKKNPEELVGKRCFEVIHSRDKPLPDCPYHRMKVTKKAETLEINDPNVGLSLLINVSPLFDDNGEHIGCVHVAKDITERKKAEDDLLKSEKKYRELVEVLNEGIWVIDKDSNTTFVNPRMAEMLGYTVDEMQGKHLFSFMDEKGVEIAKHLLERRKQGIEEQHDFEFVRKDGKRIYAVLETTPLTDENGNYTGAIAGVMDVTARRKTEKALRESEEKLRNVFAASPDAITVTDLNGNIVECNQATLDLHGYQSREGIIGKNAFEFIAKKDHKRAIENLKKTFEHGSAKNVEYTFLTKDRREFSGELSASAVMDASGKPEYFVAITKDVTERKKMEEQLKDYAEHLEEKVEERTNQLKKAQEQLLKAEKLAAIGEVATMVGHDLRNPLQAITNTLYLSGKKSKSIPVTEKEILEKHGFLELMSGLKEQVEYMDKIVSDLQDYARPLNPMLVEVGLHQLINKTLSSLTVPENVKVSMVTEEDFPKLTLDPLLMQRVFSNLITNAVQAMPNGGQLTINASKKGETALIMVEDTGAGIPDENLSKLFTPLFTTKAKGQGLGLPVCKRMVAAHDGNITVESKVGKGSTFTVEIPLRKEVSYK